jgi:hypothetical protein
VGAIGDRPRFLAEVNNRTDHGFLEKVPCDEKAENRGLSPITSPCDEKAENRGLSPITSGSVPYYLRLPSIT